MTTAAKRIGLRKMARTGGTFYYSPSLPQSVHKFVTWSHWNEDAHHDAGYDVSKTLELYDGMFRVPRALNEHEDQKLD
jgi:hypothetical protein